MTVIAKFKANIDHPVKPSVCLLTVISMNSEKQSGDNFKAFLSLLNEQYANQVNKLIIVVSGGLHLHYTKLNKNLTEEQTLQLVEDMDNGWINDHRELIKNSNFSYEIRTWDKLPKNKDHQTFFNQVVDDYNFKDKEFKCKVDKYSGKYYAEKLYQKLRGKVPGIKFDDCRNAAINYVLEECAALEGLSYLADYLVYPGKMNPCVEHMHEKYFAVKKDFIRYQEYIIKPILDQNMTINNNFFINNKKAIRHHVLNSTKGLLNNAGSNKVMAFIRDFNELVDNIKKDEEKYICRHRRLSL